MTVTGEAGRTEVCGPELEGHAVLVEGIVYVRISYVRTLQEKT